MKVEEIVQYYSYLDAAPGSLAATAPTSNAPKFGWQVPVGVAATGITAEKATLGTRGQWRTISADGQIYGFLYALATLIRKTPCTKAMSKVLDLLAATAMHCPMDVYPFAVTPDLAKHLFLKSFQIMENFRKTEEDQAASGWKICCIFNQARQMVERGRDVNDALVDFFEPIEFAASSEYRMENLKNN